MAQRAGRAGRWLGIVLSAFASGCAYDLSFKGVTFEQVDYDRLFETCRGVVIDEYAGRVVRADAEAGTIESDPVDFSVKGGTRREQVYVHLDRRGAGAVFVELMAPISEMDLDPDREDPVRWVPKGSDVKQENRLLDRIVGETLLDQPEARVIDDR